MAVIGAAFAAAACGDSLGLIPPSVDNFVDTTTLYALQGTDVGTPSAYDIVNRTPSHTQLGEPFDFAFDIDSAGRAVLYPAALLGRETGAGLQLSDVPFDSLSRAPADGYVTDSVLPIGPDVTFVARSRSSAQLCVFLGSLPRYGKFRVLSLDPATRSVRLEVLVDLNCGYRSLEPGLPDS